MVDARSHTCKSHDFIPRYDIILGITASSCDNGHKALLHACYKALQAFYRDFCPFIQQDLAALIKILVWVVHTGDCMAQFIPNMFYGVWGCSPAILQVAPSWWCCLTEGNQALPKHGGVWHYCLRSALSRWQTQCWTWGSAWRTWLGHKKYRGREFIGVCCVLQPG